MPGPYRGACQPHPAGAAEAWTRRIGEPATDDPRPAGPRGRRGVRPELPLSREARLLEDAFLDPLGVAGEDLVDGPGCDARHVVAVQLRYAGDQLVCLCVRRLEDGGDLV